MFNKTMEALLASGEAVDVNKIGTPLDREGSTFRLREFHDGAEYCDALRERWMGSIGRNMITGETVAAVDSRFYESANFECLWLR